MTRHFWVLVHRYAGLFLAAWLVVIGITGSIIVFNPELESWLNPPPVVVERNTPALDPPALRERALAIEPRAMINALVLYRKPGEPYSAFVEPRIDPATGQAFDLGYSTLFLDPYTGQEVGREMPHDQIWPLTRHNILTVINRLHYQLALPGSIGTWLFGIVAVVWTIDCFVSAYLTFPLRATRRRPGTVMAARSWVHRWWDPAWLVKWGRSFYRVNFDLHRAGGLWIWILLLAFAWSGVGFNLPGQVYGPVMRTVFAMPDAYGDALPTRDTPAVEAPMPWQEALATGRRLIADAAARDGFRVLEEDFLEYLPDKAAYLYIVRSDRDLWDQYGSTTLTFDGSGQRLSLFVPTGDNAGASLHTWIFALHMAKIWGMPFRIFVTLSGFLVTLLSVTGVYIWWKKRSARLRSAPASVGARQAAPAA